MLKTMRLEIKKATLASASIYRGILYKAQLGACDCFHCFLYNTVAVAGCVGNNE